MFHPPFALYSCGQQELSMFVFNWDVRITPQTSDLTDDSLEHSGVPFIEAASLS